jgi:DNA polymerase (family X)
MAPTDEEIAPQGQNALSPRRTLGEVLPVAESLLTWLRTHAPGLGEASVVGPLRRRAELVGDVHLLASAPHPAPVLQALTRAPQVAQVPTLGERTCVVRLAESELLVHLRVLPVADFATALLHATGSEAHLSRLRRLAHERGLRLSAEGLFREEGSRVPVPGEAALYPLLGMQYVPPEMREDSGEVEAALAGQLPEDLLALEHVQGAVHSHSTWSDGRHSLEAMARAAAARGLRYLTVTEHSQSSPNAGGLKLEALFRQWEEIDRINHSLAPTGFRLLKGIEADILESGALDYPDSVLERLEVVIGSVHMRYGMDEERMTRRLLAALDNPHLHILGHPTGRWLPERAPYPLRMEEVLDKAAERRVVVEVNGKPPRLDLKAEHVRLALRRGVRLVASCDAHCVEDLDNLAYAVATARRGWARREDVLNTLPAERFVSALRSRA